MATEEKKDIDRLKAQIERMEKLSSLGTLSAGIAHEIQNPLNFVINFSKLSVKLVKELIALIDEEKRRMAPAERARHADFEEEAEEIMTDLEGNLQKIESHGCRALDIIRGILLYTRGQDCEKLVETDPAPLVKEYVHLAYHSLRASHKGFNISIREDYAPDLPKVRMVPQDYSRAVLNVMSNACYAVYARSRVAPPDYRPTITIRLLAADGELRLAIEDNGTGMSEEVRRQMFTAFFTTKPAGEGTGLGLSITRNIIEDKHRGRVEVESEEGRFTRVTLVIPLQAPVP